MKTPKESLFCKVLLIHAYL